MTLPLAVQALVQNQVNQILKETHQRQWDSWHHDDLRTTCRSLRLVAKRDLVSKVPSLLSGHLASFLRDDAWSPLYILSVCIPRDSLVECSYATPFRLYNVMWQHDTSKAISITLYNNHLDVNSSFSQFAQGAPSTNCGSTWAVGNNGNGFLRASTYLVKMFDNSPAQGVHKKKERASQFGLGLRVGHSVGGLVHDEAASGNPDQLVLWQENLTPYSWKAIQATPGPLLFVAVFAWVVLSNDRLSLPLRAKGEHRQRSAFVL